MLWPMGQRGLSEEPGSWNTMPISRRTARRSFAEMPVMRRPATVSSPPATGSRPTAARAMVVLPDPDSPTTPTTSPGWMSNEAPVTARNAGTRPSFG